MDRKFVKSGGIVERQVRNEHLLVPVMRTEATLDSLFVLNETAQFIWTRAVAGASENDIAAALADAFAVPPAAAAADTHRVLEELLSIGALERQGGA